MSCLTPNYVVLDESGHFVRFGGHLTEGVLEAYNDNTYGTVAPIPCGKCLGCRIDRSKNWADRMLLEYATEREGQPAKRALFCTMTYDEQHLHRIVCTDNSYRGTLDKHDCQTFLKRLRKSIYPRKVRYYLAGEYGDTTFRPHYHAILFGLSLDSFPDSFVYSIDHDLCTELYESPTLDSLWSHGAVRFSVANYATFAYVSRYVTKKIFASELGAEYYKGRVPPFQTQSLKPGLGADYFQDDFSLTAASIFDGSEVHQISIPRCVLQKIQLTNPELYDSIKATRRAVADSRMELLTEQTDTGYLSTLSARQAKLIERTKLLRRSKV